MQQIELYKYDNADKSVTVTPNKRNDTDTPHAYRLIADEGMELYNGEISTLCIDVPLNEDISKWIEREYVEPPIDEEATEQDYIDALAELGVQINEEENIEE